jgi:hypothetical protein
MTGRERVAAVMRGEIPDKVPFGEFAVDFDTVEKVIGRQTYYRAKARSQIALWEGRRDEVVQSWKADGIEFFRKMPVFDIINFSMCAGIAPPKGWKPADPPRRIDETTWEDSCGRVFKYSEVTADITCVHDPTVWQKQYRKQDFDPEADPEPMDESCLEVVRAMIEAFAEDRYVLSPSGGEVAMVMLGGMERGMIEMVERPELIRHIGRCRVHQANQRSLQQVDRRCGGIMFGGQDFAYKSGPFISPEMFRDLALPNMKARCDFLNAHFPGMPLFKHACGNNWPLLDMFVEAGIECYQSIQHSAGMDIRRLKQAYGDRLVLWGGAQVENLVSGTKADLQADVDYAMKWAKPGGRYIFGSTHSIAVGTNYDNFMYMLEAFEKAREY